MKIIFKLIIILTTIYTLDCQIPLEPVSHLDTLGLLKPKDVIETYTTSTPNMEYIYNFIDSLDSEKIVHPDIFGFNFDVELKLKHVGTWDTLANGDRIWRYKIVCPSAFTVNFLLKDFELADNSHISFYNEKNESLLGPYNKNVNREHKIFTTHIIINDSVYIELFEPKIDAGKNTFTLSEITYGFKDLTVSTRAYKKVSTTQSLSCHIDANCSEGNEYCREKYSVARILVPFQGAFKAHCTASLLNNVKEDFKPYLLTAFHCMDVEKPWYVLSNAEKNWSSSWNIQFGYLSPGCNATNVSKTKEYSGATFRAGWNPTDFLLVELQEQPESGSHFNVPNDFRDVYYNGWDRSGNLPDYSTSLHHPEGDVLKISKDYNPATNFTWVGQHFQVVFDAGAIQHGSSGGPLFDENRNVIGQLHGNYYFVLGSTDLCLDRRGHYGKLSSSWSGGGTSSTRLKDWLDPDNTGAMSINGRKLTNIQLGRNILNGIYTIHNARSDLMIGSNSTDSYRVQSGGNLTLKAGREIIINPCTQIKSGSEFRAFIQHPACYDFIYPSHKLVDHNPSICSAYPKLVKEDQNFDSPFMGNTTLTISPNPVTSISDIKLTVGAADNVSLVLYDNLGNQRFSYLENISLKSGTYNYKLDGNELNSGMFILVLKIDGRVLTEKVINLK